MFFLTRNLTVLTIFLNLHIINLLCRILLGHTGLVLYLGFISTFILQRALIGCLSLNTRLSFMGFCRFLDGKIVDQFILLLIRFILSSLHLFFIWILGSKARRLLIWCIRNTCIWACDLGGWLLWKIRYLS